MKNSPWIRYFMLGVFLHLILYILGIALFLVYFPLRKKIAKNKTPFLWWFLNSDEGDYVSNTYGDLNYRIRKGFDYETANWLEKTWYGFLWLAIRNSHWNFRVNVIRPKQGVVADVEIIINDTQPESQGMTFCNYTIWGEQYAKYTIEGTRYYRYSFTKTTPNWMRFLGLKNMWNVHMGWSTNRWIFKSRWF